MLFYQSDWDAQQQVLSLVVAPISGPASKILLTGWPQSIQWYLWQDGELECHDDPFEPSLFPIEFFNNALLQGWRETIPLEVMTRLQCYGGNPFGILMIISRDMAAYQLFIDHPLLFILLYQYAIWHRHDIDWLLQHCRMKRIEILSICGLPAKPSAVKLLGKIAINRLTRLNYDLIVKVMQLDYTLLNHQVVISRALLNTLVNYPMLLKSPLLRFWKDENTDRLLDELGDIERMRQHRFFPPERLEKELQKCRSISDVFKLHDRLVQSINSYDNYLDVKHYPEPPLAGNAHIIPITHYRDLLAEGRTQRHCVASYHAAIAKGTDYVYRILAPERATLGLKILANHSSGL